MHTATEMLAVHIAGVNNITADALSRFRILTSDTDQYPERMIKDRIWRSILNIIPCLNYDAFASVANAKFRRFSTANRSFFEYKHNNSDNYFLFPPRYLIKETINFMKSLSSKQEIWFVLFVPDFQLRFKKIYHSLNLLARFSCKNKNITCIFSDIDKRIVKNVVETENYLLLSNNTAEQWKKRTLMNKIAPRQSCHDDQNQVAPGTQAEP